MERHHLRWACAPAACALALTAAACGSSGGKSSAGSSTGASSSANVSYAKAQIDKFRAVPKFVAPGPAFDAAKLVKGKTLLSIPASSAIPFVETIQQGLKRISAQVGVKFIDWPNQGQPPQWVQGMNAAVDRKANAINLLAGINPASLGPQIAAAKRAGIPTIVSHLYDVNQPSAPGVDVASIHYKQAGQLLADWAIADTNAKANALVVTINEVVSTQPMVAGIKQEFSGHCPGCKLSYVNVAIPDVATRIQPQVQSALVKDPGINYVIALYDSAEAPFAVAGIKAAGKTGRVKVVTFNGTPSVLKMVQDGDVAMDVGENLDWIAHGVMDQAMRLMAGKPPVKDPNLPLRVFDKTNVGETGTPPQLDRGFGAEYKTEYAKLWGLQP
jgi:ribose transport system substrate-binding protein